MQLPQPPLVRRLPRFTEPPTDAEIAALMPDGFVAIHVVGRGSHQRTVVSFALREFPATKAALAEVLREAANCLTAPSIPDPELT